MGIGFLAFLVSFSGIDVTVGVVFRVVLNFIVSHGVSPHIGFGCRLLSCLTYNLGTEGNLAIGEEWQTNDR